MKICLQPYWKREDGFAATTTALILAGVAVAGAATSAYGSMAAAQSQKKAADFNSTVAKNNATASTQQAMADADRIKQQGRRVVGQQVAAAAAAGIDPNTGTSTDIQYDSRIQNQLQQLTTKYKGQVSAGNYQSQAQLDRFQGQSALTSGYLRAGGTLLSGAGTAAYSYASVANNPGFGSNWDSGMDNEM